jgi:serine/threonine-protein kinase
VACGRAGPRPATGRDLPICPECRDEMRRRDQPIAGYRIIRELGQGGMGIVYLALREGAGDLVALKMIVPEVAVAARKEDVERFVREASIVRGLDHPNIVAFRDAGESGGRIYFAMEYVPGIDASRLLREDGGPLPIPRAVNLVGQLLEALEYAHARKFVHRDIKPGNLLVKREDGRDRALLADFGLARAYQASRLSGLTMTDDLRGTPAFMAPEQITNFREAKPATDLYSAGATLYNLLTGRHILDFPKRQELKLLMILENDPVPIRSRRPEVSEALAAVVHRALAKDPADRHPDARAMRAALAASLGKR